MTVVGEAIYEITAKDAALLQGLKKAEGAAAHTGDVVEKAVGDGGEKGFSRGGAAASRFGGILDRVRGSAGKMGGVLSAVAQGALMGVGLGAFMAVGAAAGEVVGKIGESISAASDLNETISKVGVVFGKNADDVIAWGQDSARSMGLSRQAALEAAGTIGNLFVSLGLATDKSAEMSTSMVKLAGDLASFNNTDPAEALDALRAGLVGETEPLRRFGVNLNEATISQKALAMGLVTTTKGVLPPAIRAQAAYALILDQTKTAQGDFARTSNGLANQQRISAARMQDSLARMGQALLPIATAILPIFTDALAGAFEAIGTLISGIGDWIAQNRGLTDALGTVANIIGTVLVFALGKLGDWIGVLWKVTSTAWGAIVSIIKGAVGTIVNVVEQLFGVIASIPGPWQAAAKDVQATLSSMRKSVDEWGSVTGTTVGKAADDVVQAATTAGEQAPAAMAAGLASGAPAVADAAQAGLVDPAVQTVKKTPAQLIAEAKQAVDDYATGLKSGYDEVVSGADSLVEALKHPISTSKRIAQIEGVLSGKALAAALKSSDPLIRAAAESLKQKAEDELALLKGIAKDEAGKAGRDYAAGLRQQEAAARLAAANVVAGAKGPLGMKDAKTWGQHAGQQWADGLASQYYYLKKAAEKYASGARGPLEFTLPDEGPLQHMDRWGEHAGQEWAKGLSSQSGFLKDQVNRFLSPVEAAMQSRLTFGDPLVATNTADVTVRHVIEDPNRTLAAAGMTERGVGDALVRGLDATGFIRNLRHVANMG